MTDTGEKKKPMNKTAVLNALAESSGLSKQQVTDVLDSLAELIGKEIGNEGPGVFTVPGLLKIKAVHKPAVPERMGINPFTKEETLFKAKPASTAVKVVALKGLKDLV